MRALIVLPLLVPRVVAFTCGLCTDKLFPKPRSSKCSYAEDADVCRDAVPQQAPIFAKVLRNNGEGSPAFKALSAFMLGVCSVPSITPRIPSLSPKPARGRPSWSSGKAPIQVVHFSDIHIDPLYLPGANTDCGKPICCSDKPGNNDSPAGLFGDHDCDVPHTLEKSMYDAIRTVAPNAAFAIFTGDIVDHAVWDTSARHNKKSIRNAYDVMRSQLGNLTVFAIAGNHEAHPVNAFPTRDVREKTPSLHRQLSAEWSRWIDVDAKSDTQECFEI
ncbi:hypothetical protein XA68_14224 [Ophiocordyceps unilateralis]|uniref:Calcineurin-like phosphoesterase domain-containing protein n=1 Tax=Ophiocordyceps unilateralis TaxID=268505 RepID=A0A2A9PA23_OPHUN|nr:hypothetical protein XA68_14224 [Ophiocordyceps unilateralis]